MHAKQLIPLSSLPSHSVNSTSTATLSKDGNMEHSASTFCFQLLIFCVFSCDRRCLRSKLFPCAQEAHHIGDLAQTKQTSMENNNNANAAPSAAPGEVGCRCEKCAMSKLCSFRHCCTRPFHTVPNVRLLKAKVFKSVAKRITIQLSKARDLCMRVVCASKTVLHV